MVVATKRGVTSAAETIARTNLSYFQIGTPVNLERPLAAGRPIGGHFVQGHVDGIVRVQATVREGDFVRMTLSVPEALRPFLVSKGSVAVNGVSLTVAALGELTFDVQLVPHTLERTNLTAANRAEAANLEVDILGKYVASFLGSWTGLRSDEASDRQELLGGDTLITLPGD